METDCSWAENVFVSKGNLAHETVDAGKASAARGAIVERAVRVYHDGWGLFGVIDCLELRPGAGVAGSKNTAAPSG
ncbi:hypothetical protein SDC9_205965 [bioreactor metagenome]|uniref:Uncharacterized protein n=1 Tax=bioreactor metagenome TaxID=1076179 RepID=A0A645J547_9ZZZZ